MKMDSVSPIDISSDSDVEIQEYVGNRSNSRANPPRVTAGNGSSSIGNNISKPGLASSTSDYKKLSSQQASKRTLLPSFNSSASSSRTGSSATNGSGNQMRESYGNPNRFGVSTVSSIKGHNKDHHHAGADENNMIRGVNVVRTPPSSISHGVPSTSSRYSGSIDTTHRFGMAEEKQFGQDERLIYQAALEDLNQPKSEHSPPDGVLSVPLLRHQKIALAWMVQKETRSLHCLGGILADDQGLGKTVSMIALMQVQKPSESKSKQENMSDKKLEALDLEADDENVDSKNAYDNDGKSTLGGSECKDLNNGKAEFLDLDDFLGNSCSGSENVKVEEEGTSTQVFSRKRPAAGTLVVCPASIVRQWARELDEKVSNGAKLRVLIYHGPNRTKDPVELASFDVVLTTYAIVTNEVPKQPTVDEDEADEKNMEKYGISSFAFSSNKKRKIGANASKKVKRRRGKSIDSLSYDNDCGALARVRWFRVILDEAQTIKNHRTQVARACCSLRAKRRWCLSGTPIQNTIDDLYSYFRFLRYDPYAVYRSFYSAIKVPISRNSLHGYKKLQAVLRAIMLRRTKGTLIDGEPIIKLPPKSIHLAKVDFSASERAFYRQLEADSRSQFKAYAAAGTLNQNYANILLMLLRLRQACDHPFLVKGYNSDAISHVSEETVKKLPRDARIDLLNCLESSFAICLVCHDPPEDAIVTLCGHVFCYQCVSEYLTGDDNSCPVPNCKEQLGHDFIFSKSTLRSCTLEDSGSGSTIPDRYTDKLTAMHNYSSSKIRAVIEILQSHLNPKSTNFEPLDCSANGQIPSSSPTEGGPIKTIVFSQWTGMLDLVQSSLSESCIRYRRLDGTMSLAARDRAVKDFSNNPEVTVMLMSLKAGNLGLNMVAACHVILLDLWWNPTTEDQAVDRAHRIGQTRPVTVTRLTVKDTVEDRILALQDDKRKMAASAFGEDQGGSSATRLTVDDLKYLFMV